MAVDQPTIKLALQTLYSDAKTTPMTETEFADRMATIIKDAILSGEVTVTGVQPGGGVASGTIL